MRADDFIIKEVENWRCNGCYFRDDKTDRCRAFDSNYTELLIEVRILLGGCIRSDGGIIYIKKS